MIIQNMMVRKRPSIVKYLVLLISLSACSQRGAPGSVQGEFVMGTYCTIDLFEDGNPVLYGKLFTRLAELEMIFSANRDDSELAKVNQNAGIRAVTISRELYTVLKRALYFAEATDGAFDPTIGPLVKLWGIGTEKAHIPPEEEIKAALALVDYREIELIAENQGSASGTAFLRQEGMALDLGAIAKGFAADELINILRKTGVKRAIINLGGNIYVWGKKKNGESWNIGVQDPLSERGISMGVLELEGSISVVSSGIYERFFVGSDGKHYHHILELTEQNDIGEIFHQGGRRGYPVENGILSATVIAVSSMDADALSTSCFILGAEKGIALAMANGAEVLFIEEETIRGSPGALSIFTLSE